MNGKYRERGMTRREALFKGAAALAVAGTAPRLALAANPVPQSPGLAEGTYWLDGMPQRVNIKTNTATGVVQAGFSLRLVLHVARIETDLLAPAVGARVDIWQANALGVYSGISAQGTSGQDFLRGYQLTDIHGNAYFETVYPGWIAGSTPFINIRVRLFSGSVVTYEFVSRLYFEEAVTTSVFATAPYSTRPGRDTFNDTDPVFIGPSVGNGGQVASDAGQLMLLTLAKRSDRAIGLFNVVL
jgi:protocatechuate 3,4-dioxygenase beta subunit